jgi:putative membrane protein
MMMYGNNTWGWIGWILMSFGMVAFWAVVITAIVLAVRWLIDQRGNTSASVTGQSRAEDLLAERFARGEIDDNEYRKRLALLREQADVAKNASREA